MAGASGEEMNPVTGSPEDALRAIWQKHRASALERVGVIERAVRALTAADLDEQLRVEAHRTAHSLIGSVGTFGFLRACEAARQLELELADPNPQHAPELSRLIAVIYSELQGEALAAQGARRIEPADDLRVLVVDDDRELCERLAAEASSRGVQCDTAASPREAREALCGERPPTVVLLDLTFPPDGTRDAYALLSELSAATPPIPVLVLTGTGAFTDRRRGRAARQPRIPAQVAAPERGARCRRTVHGGRSPAGHTGARRR